MSWLLAVSLGYHYHSSSSGPLSTAMRPPFLSQSKEINEIRENEKICACQKVLSISSAVARGYVAEGTSRRRNQYTQSVALGLLVLDSLLDTPLANISAKCGRRAASGLLFAVQGPEAKGWVSERAYLFQTWP